MPSTDIETLGRALVPGAATSGIALAAAGVGFVVVQGRLYRSSAFDKFRAMLDIAELHSRTNASRFRDLHRDDHLDRNPPRRGRPPDLGWCRAGGRFHRLRLRLSPEVAIGGVVLSEPP